MSPDNVENKAAADEAAASVSVHASTSPPYTVKDGVVEVADAADATPAVQQERPYNPAAWMHERIVRQILEFEKGLDPNHEVGGRFVQGPSNETLHIENVANWGPDMIVFLGQFPDGRKFQLMQHYSQANVLLVSVPKMRDKPRRIGLEMMKTVQDQPHPWGDPIS